MKILIDANIVFSAILNSKSKIGDLIFNSKNIFEFFAPKYLKSEIEDHYLKIIKISNLTFSQIKQAEFLIYKEISFISEDKISKSNWLLAEKLVLEIDLKDTP